LGIINDAHKTWKIYVGVGATEQNELRGIEYAAKSFVVYDDLNFTTPYPEAHPTLEGIFYIDKHVQPSSDPCLGATLQAAYGNITASYLYQTSAAQLQTGDTLLAVYDYQEQLTYLAYPDFWTGVPAYERPMVLLNMTELFNIEV
jgi:hypothetical protein